MIETTKKNKISRYIVLFAVILVLDLLAIIGNLYIAPILENFGMPDALIYIKTLITLSGLIIFILYYFEKIPLTYEVIKIILHLAMISIIAYFVSMYLYKFALITKTSDDILLKILRGNSNLVLDVSRTNYNVLQYIITIFSGANSELILFGQALLLQYVIIKSKVLETTTEATYIYDDFLYDRYLKYAVPILLGLSFLSINLFTFRFDLLGLIEMILSLLAFGIILPSVYLLYHIVKTKNALTKPSVFAGTHLYFKYMSIISILLFVVLAGLNIYFIILGRGTYRVLTSVLALGTSILVLVRSLRILSLENKYLS